MSGTGIDNETLYEAIGEIGEDLLARSETRKKVNRFEEQSRQMEARRASGRGRRRSFAGAALSLAAVAVLSFAGWQVMRGSSGASSTSTEFYAPAAAPETADAYLEEAETAEGYFDETETAGAYLEEAETATESADEDEVVALAPASHDMAESDDAVWSAGRKDRIESVQAGWDRTNLILGMEGLEVILTPSEREAETSRTEGEMTVMTTDGEVVTMYLYASGQMMFSDEPGVYYETDAASLASLRERMVQ